MASVAIPMTVLTLTYVAVNVLMWKGLKDRALTIRMRVAIGIFYGFLSILSTHFGVNYGTLVLNVRDLGPMSAGLLFDPLSGIIAGLIGGIERYIAGTYWGIAPFTRVACSIATCLAGFLAAFLNIFIFRGKRPSVLYAFSMGAFIEVFHMYMIFISHGDNMDMAYYVVHASTVPMIFFNSVGIAASVFAIKALSGELHNPISGAPDEEVSISSKFQKWLFVATLAVFALNFGLDYVIQTTAALQSTHEYMTTLSMEIAEAYNKELQEEDSFVIYHYNVGHHGQYYIVNSEGKSISGASPDSFGNTPDYVLELVGKHPPGEFFTEKVQDVKTLCLTDKLEDGSCLVMMMPETEIYSDRDREAYESILNDVIVFAVIYILVSLLIENIVAKNLSRVNTSLRKITEGDLDETVSVYSSSEFASLSNDINQTVSVLKGYIKAAEQRIEQELILARTIQLSALPRNFDFRHEGFEIYATMDPAREVGGDFFDFFFVDVDKLALVIADVSGKGIPAALLMMRAKTTIRSLAETGKGPAEVMRRTNEELCVNNDADMFVTAWIGIFDLVTGTMECVNAGHEYPAIKRRGGEFALMKRKHNLPLGSMEGLEFMTYEIHLDPGDCIFVYTDGVPEAANEQSEQFGTDRMIGVLNENKYSSQQDLLKSVKAGVDSFIGITEQFDDMTMIGFRYNGMKSL